MTPQLNKVSDTWADFYAESRIGHMLHLLANQGIRFVDIDAAVEHIKALLKEHTPVSSMLHGDLWRGNVGFFKQQAVLFDPAFYFGDRETDIAMTELFGRFPTPFYTGYNNTWQLDAGYQKRKPLYQLYHILNHALMFGGHYMQSAKDTLMHLQR
jgi:fructosamine-3-kinase